MKKFLVLIYFIVFSVSILSQGLVAYYPFNGNADDSSGNGNNGTIFNGLSFTQDRFGASNSSASFDGVDDYVRVANSSTFPSQAITMAYWINRQSLNPTALENYISKEQAFQSYIYNTDKKLWSGVWLGSGGNWLNFNSGSYIVPIDNNWFFYAFTYDNTNKTAKTYINGALISTEQTTNASAIIRTSTFQMYIGRNGSSAVYYVKGLIDDMRIYNRVLADTELLQLYHENGWTDIDEKNGPVSNFFLSQNYPNPFNPTTKINFSIPKTENVSLKVYDIIGNKVTTLVDESKSAGKYEIIFDASSLSSGIYFYKIITESFVETKKMVFLK
jgi:hypothetical protein